MTSNRIRKNRFYDEGRLYAEAGLAEAPADGDHAGEEAFKAGFVDRSEELERDREHHRQQTESLTLLLHEARAGRDFDKLCLVVERLIEKVEE